MNIAQSQVVGREGVRSKHEKVLDLAEHLAVPDRLLVEQVFRHGIPVAQVALLTGRPARGMQRKLERLLQRLNSPLFRFVAGRLDALDPPVRAAAHRVVLQGATLRQTAAATGQTLHAVRQGLTAIKALARTLK